MTRPKSRRPESYDPEPQFNNTCESAINENISATVLCPAVHGTACMECKRHHQTGRAFPAGIPRAFRRPRLGVKLQALTPAAPLGTTGFDMGVEVTRTNMTNNSQAWSKITGSGMAVTDLYVPKLHVAKGLPFGIDVAAFYSKTSTTNISLFGGALSYAILQSAPAQPAVTIRGTFTRMVGVSQLMLNTKSLDLSVSQGFGAFTPYAGIGRVWVNSMANVGPVLQNEGFTQGKVFVGANLNLIFTRGMRQDGCGKVDKPEAGFSLLGVRCRRHAARVNAHH